MTKSTEQQARDLLERMEVEGAQSYSAGELVELANLIHDSRLLTMVLTEVHTAIKELRQAHHTLRHPHTPECVECGYLKWMEQHDF